MNSIWSAICNSVFYFPKGFFFLNLKFPLVLDLLLVGFTIRFPDFAVLLSLVCWGCTPSVVVFCGFCQVVIPQVVGSLMLGEVVLLGFVSYLASKRLYRMQMVELMGRRHVMVGLS